MNSLSSPINRGVFNQEEEIKKLRNQKKSKNEEKIQRQLHMEKIGFITKEKVLSNFSTSLVNGRTATRVFRHLESSFRNKSLVAFD